MVTRGGTGLLDRSGRKNSVGSHGENELTVYQVAEKQPNCSGHCRSTGRLKL